MYLRAVVFAVRRGSAGGAASVRFTPRLLREHPHPRRHPGSGAEPPAPGGPRRLPARGSSREPTSGRAAAAALGSAGRADGAALGRSGLPPLRRGRGPGLPMPAGGEWAAITGSCRAPLPTPPCSTTLLPLEAVNMVGTGGRARLGPRVWQRCGQGGRRPEAVAVPAPRVAHVNPVPAPERSGSSGVRGLGLRWAGAVRGAVRGSYFRGSVYFCRIVDFSQLY